MFDCNNSGLAGGIIRKSKGVPQARTDNLSQSGMSDILFIDITETMTIFEINNVKA